LLGVGVVLLLFPLTYAAVCGDGVCEQADVSSGCSADCQGASFVPLFSKETSDRKQFEFCQQPTDCLVSAIGDYAKDGNVASFFDARSEKEKPHCIHDSQYVLDQYCQQGQWTSRTGVVAASLLSLQSGQFRLFCGLPEDVANRMDLTVRNKLLSEYVRRCQIGQGLFDCVNNFCMITYEGGSALGTSYNVDPSTPRGFLNALDFDANSCDGVQGFGKCTQKPGDGAAVYIDRARGLIFYVSDGKVPVINTDVRGVFDQEKNKIADYAKTQNPGFDIFRKIQLYRELYVARGNGREAFAFLERDVETPALDLFGVRYVNTRFEGPPCETYFGPLDTTRFSCSSQTAANTQFIVARNEPTTFRQGLAALWRDATAKLR